MKGQPRRPRKLIWSLAALLLLLGMTLACAKETSKKPPFEYAGGTENVEQHCKGDLEVTSEALVFKCPTGSMQMPFSSITLMQYRPNVSREVRKMKPRWKVRPHRGRGRRNRYFIVAYNDQSATHVVVLKVAPSSMRPYLAEIELRSGKRVQVFGYEQYD